MQLQEVSGRPQGQDKLTQSSQNVLFDKDVMGQVAGFSQKLTSHQQITNTGSFKVE
jgi:hypothetical protein